MCEDMPRLNDQIRDLEEQLAQAKRKTEACQVWKDCNGADTGMKQLVPKLDGNPKGKFELDHKLSSAQFHKILCTLAMPEVEEGAEKPDHVELYNKYLDVFKKALVEGVEPFKGDVENVTYKNILVAFRAFDPNAPTD